MKLGISEILELVENEENVEKKIDILRKFDNTALRDIFIYTFHPNIKFLLPVGPMPDGSVKYNTMPECEGLLYSEMKRLYLFVEGGNTNLSTFKREQLWISLLEKINFKDAYLLINVKDKKLPYSSITPHLINEAFPNLLPLDLIEEMKQMKNSLNENIVENTTKIEVQSKTSKKKSSKKKVIETVDG